MIKLMAKIMANDPHFKLDTLDCEGRLIHVDTMENRLNVFINGEKEDGVDFNLDFNGEGADPEYAEDVYGVWEVTAECKDTQEIVALVKRDPEIPWIVISED